MLLTTLPLSDFIAPDGIAAGDFFTRSYEQIAREERRLRQLTEVQLRAYQKLVQDLATRFAAGVLDATKHADPKFSEHASPDTWRQLFDQAQASPAGWQATAPAGEAWRLEAERLRDRVRELETTLNLLRAAQGANAPRAAPGVDPGGSPAPVVAPPPDGSVPSPTAKADPGGSAPADNAKQLASAATRPGVLPAMPPEIPDRFALRIENWPRVAAALAALATTGIAMRQELLEILANEFQVGVRAGSLPKLFAGLVEHGLAIEEKLVIRGVHKPKEGVTSDTTLILLRLTPKGSDLARACGLHPVESEWESLIRLHSGAAQPAHTGLVCAFTYHARRRGYATEVCPAVEAPARPDVLLTQAGALLYVEVEGESGTPERRLTKWQNQVALQGKVALCAPTPQIRATLVNEAKAAGAEHGLATDLQSLFDTQAERGPLWAYEW